MNRRLRVSDLLDCYVSSPACYLPDEVEEPNDLNHNQGLTKVPERSTSLIKLLGSLSKPLGGLHGELRSLYLALCHKCHVRILLWDGLYACSESESEDPALPLTTAPTDAVRVSTTPSDSLVFDGTKCSDSMSIIPNPGDATGSHSSLNNGSAVNQRASKVWGTVLSSTSFSPKTGIQRWAVRLDKCERGHVFIGVATAQASTRTYVGGDKYGWGMIGTQALWHDRRKIRGDYGAMFRTGSTIVVTLDTDAGTLSFSSWKDNSLANSFALDPLVQNSSPRRQALVGGAVEDWGVAFEGLPLDSRLYPAVGLYQRDDRVTLLSVESGTVAVSRDSLVDVGGGLCYYPRVVERSAGNPNVQLDRVQNFNDLLSWEGIEYVARTLEEVVESFQNGIDESLPSILLPSLGAALSLIPPSIPVLSQRFALALLPRLTKCLSQLEEMQVGHQRQTVFRSRIQEGKWVIRATGSSASTSDSEEYIVDITSTTDETGAAIGFEGTGVGTTGKSKNGLVSIVGSVIGSSLHFVEEWSDGNAEDFRILTSDEASSSCVVNARLSLDGRKFEGHYRNVQFGTSGQIAGLLQVGDRQGCKYQLKEAPLHSKHNNSHSGTLGKMLLCLAHTHLASMLAEDSAADFSYPLPRPDASCQTSTEWKSRYLQLKNCWKLPIFASSFSNTDIDKLLAQMECIRTLYFTQTKLAPTDQFQTLVSEHSFRRLVVDHKDASFFQTASTRVEKAVTEADKQIMAIAGGNGALSALARSEYNDARLCIISALVHHCGVETSFIRAENSLSADAEEIWLGAQRIMDEGVRRSIAEECSRQSIRERARNRCLLYKEAAQFLLLLEVVPDDSLSIESTVTDVSDFFKILESSYDIDVLRDELERSTQRGLLRLISIHETLDLLKLYSRIECTVALESLATGIPRILGRGCVHSFTGTERQSERNEVNGDLGGHYLHNVPCLSGVVNASLETHVHTLWGVLCEIFKLSLTKSGIGSDDQVMAISLTLALVTSFTTSMRKNDVLFLLQETSLLSLMESALVNHRDVAMSCLPVTEESAAESSLVKELNEIGYRDMSRVVIRALVGLSHVLTYQALSVNKCDSSNNHGALMCLDLVFHQLETSANLAQKVYVQSTKGIQEKLGDEQWDRWQEVMSKGVALKNLSRRPRHHHRQIGRCGLDYLQEHGINHIVLSHGMNQKPQTRSRGLQQPGSKDDVDSESKLQNHFIHQMSTIWVHTVVAASKSVLGKTLVSSKNEWMGVLFNLIALNEHTEAPQKITPAQFRARILRTLLPFLELQEPSATTVNLMFQLAGRTNLISSSNYHEDECMVSREAVSLLRHLHDPCRADWRAMINDSISTILACPSQTDDVLLSKSGVVLFFNGGFENITKGSFVLMKPAAATALSAEQQASPSSKGSSGAPGGVAAFNSTPHHIVGNGTEGIVAGLCREDASAGIVSSVDTKNGLCEVILLNRNSTEVKEVESPGFRACRNKGLAPDKRGSSASRHSLTVRAVRAPLSDVTHAQEVSLYLDEAVINVDVFSAFFEEALTIRSTFHQSISNDNLVEDTTYNDIHSIKSDLLKAAYSAMVLKCVLSVLSDHKILAKFLNEGSSQDILSKVLEFASPLDKTVPTAKVDNSGLQNVSLLSWLPKHEARLRHFMHLLRGLMLRSDAVNQSPESIWERRLEECKVQVEKSEAAGVSQSTEGKSDDGYTTPPFEPAVSSDTLPIGGVGTRNQVRGNILSEARNAESAGRANSQFTATTENTEEDHDNEASTTAAAHLREAAIAQMAELGLPRSWSELALRRTGGTNIEAAVHFCLERGGEMERLLLEERERERIVQRQTSGGTTARRRGNRSEIGSSSHLLRQLMEMGFPSRWCAEALAATGNNVDEALTWILTNGERLSAEDAGMEDGEDDDDVEVGAGEDESEDDGDSQDEDETENVGSHDAIDETGTSETVSGDNTADRNVATSELQAWTGSVIPLRFISGRSIIDTKTLSISGLPTGGFSSVGTKGVLLTAGKWYYEAILETAGCLQIGWADGSFAGHCHADRGDGCGDGPSSWAYDGWRRYRWHATATEWGCRWTEGDVIGCMVDMDEKIVSFTLNGRGEEIGMGVAFSGQGFRPCGGVYACVSFNRREKLRIILGGKGSEPFKYPPPSGYTGVGEAVLAAVSERDLLVSKEHILDTIADETREAKKLKPDSEKRFLCDFSDGEHGHELMAWAHRYYGSDASVHLGSGKTKSGSLQKSSSTTTNGDGTTRQCLNRRIDKEWLRRNESTPVPCTENASLLVAKVTQGYIAVASNLRDEVLNECRALSSLYARKLLLHITIMRGDDFDPAVLVPPHASKLQAALRFWNVIETCASLRSAGWVGEAGAMAIAAEALGLGISSNDNLGPPNFQNSLSLSMVDEGVCLPAAGIVQVLTAISHASPQGVATTTSCAFVASAEASMGSEGGAGVLLFVRKGLQSAICLSPEIREVAIASLRRTIRLLSVVDYDGEDSTPSEKAEDDEEIPLGKEKVADDSSSSSSNADARLACYLTGLLLGPQIEKKIHDHYKIKVALFEAWSVGLLSASLPWRMVCAFTAAGILNSYPRALISVVDSYPTLSRYYGRLLSTVARRTWAERAASPICSRYVQAMIELLCSVRRSVTLIEPPNAFMRYWKTIEVDAATPMPFTERKPCDPLLGWESQEGWVSSDTGYEIWTGSLNILPVKWKTPTRSAVRTLMDGGDGPPMLREGCFVMRGLDWISGGNGNEDGKDLYEREKANRDSERQANENENENGNDEERAHFQGDLSVDDEQVDTPTEDSQNEVLHNKNSQKSVLHSAETKKAKKKKKSPSPKLPIGTVLSVEPWLGVPAAARRVRWHLTGEEKVYRYGGDGGRYDISHVEVNEKETRVRKRQPLPESAEQCAARHGFGVEQKYSVLLRIQKAEIRRDTLEPGSEVVRHGIMELPDFGAAIFVQCTFRDDGSVLVKEQDLVFGSKDSGWETRFGQPSYLPGTTHDLKPVESYGATHQSEIDAKTPYMSLFEEHVSSTTYNVPSLRNRDDGTTLQVTSELHLLCARRFNTRAKDIRSTLPLLESRLPPPLNFDREYHAPSLSLSRDGRTVSCISSDGRGTAFASIGFTKGVHYWEVKLEQADIGSVFIGVAEKPTGNGSGSSSGYDTPPRLNRWHGWGFVNFRATYTAGAERIYGAHCHAGDTVGVLLDCDAGRLSFFFDGLKYGEHILNDLGCAFENLSPFGFNVDGCGGGGAGQGAPSAVEGGRAGRYPAQGAVRPKALWPVVGLRNQGDRVTFSAKWNSSYGTDGILVVKNALALDEVMDVYAGSANLSPSKCREFPEWFIKEAFSEYQRWKQASWRRSGTRGSGPFELASCGLNVDFNCSAPACAAASALLGLRFALLAGDRVRLKRSAGRILELAEEAIVLGAYQGRLYYRIVSQKSEGGSLTEGGGRSWCWDESEVVEGMPTIGDPKGLGITLPLMNRFRCTSQGGLQVVYEGGAVVRSDLEIFEGSLNLGSIPVNTVLPRKDVLERRVNSCGVVRYRVRFGAIEGWISSSIRGGKEEAIVAPVLNSDDGGYDIEDQTYETAQECAQIWYDKYQQESNSKIGEVDFGIDNIESFEKHLQQGVISGISLADSDVFLSQAIGTISDVCEGGNPLDVSFQELATAISYGLATKCDQIFPAGLCSAEINQVAAAAFCTMPAALPRIESMMARVALLRALNRRAMLALPWLSLRPSQEGTAIFGGVYGHGTSIERAGRSSNEWLRSQWVQVPSIASRIRALRGLFFRTVKKDFVRSVTNVTTTPTPLSHDEYELPREIRTVRLNRLKARRVMASDDIAAKRKHSVFAQLHNETKSWGGAALRRGFVAKGHGGQKRAFKVKLIGEGVNDYSGPYREAFTDSLSEVLDVDTRGFGSLGVLDQTPNGVQEIGENRGLYMFAVNGCDVSKICKVNPKLSKDEQDLRDSFSSLIIARDEASREVEESLVFLGRITGTAFRHGIPLDLPLPMESVWKAIVEQISDWRKRLHELDVLAHRHGDEVEGAMGLIAWQQRMLNAFVEGLSNVLPVEVLCLLSGEELRDEVCGNPDIDVDLLRRVVEYEGYTESDDVVQFFWETLRELSNDERKAFLQFVWARNRLPLKESDFEAPFKIQKDTGKKCGEQALPSASTCFFSLSLPEYSTKEQLKKKLLFAIKNVTTMETDFQTNSAEIAEGYRAF